MELNNWKELNIFKKKLRSNHSGIEDSLNDWYKLKITKLQSGISQEVIRVRSWENYQNNPQTQIYLSTKSEASNKLIKNYKTSKWNISGTKKS